MSYKLLKNFLDKNEYIKDILIKGLGTDIAKDFRDLEKENKELKKDNTADKVKSIEKSYSDVMTFLNAKTYLDMKDIIVKNKDKADKFDNFDKFAVAIDGLIKGDIECLEHKHFRFINIGFGKLELIHNWNWDIKNRTIYHIKTQEFNPIKKEIEKEDYYFEFDYDKFDKIIKTHNDDELTFENEKNDYWKNHLEDVDDLLNRLTGNEVYKSKWCIQNKTRDYILTEKQVNEILEG